MGLPGGGAQAVPASVRGEMSGIAEHLVAVGAREVASDDLRTAVFRQQEGVVEVSLTQATDVGAESVLDPLQLGERLGRHRHHVQARLDVSANVSARRRLLR